MLATCFNVIVQWTARVSGRKLYLCRSRWLPSIWQRTLEESWDTEGPKLHGFYNFLGVEVIIFLQRTCFNLTWFVAWHDGADDSKWWRLPSESDSKSYEQWGEGSLCEDALLHGMAGVLIFFFFLYFVSHYLSITFLYMIYAIAGAYCVR